ncbi:GOLPH3/VPS74 family protein [Prauserella rugosa]|uniref:Golgi phosphoprotein 3 GPP34 n=1 Tax=Prauserella rugosa TaxID=43354 RepID=A0A660CI35_9PSEU|nr:GPP34 family phosphoprotein [Prauserella rugosa]KMS86823.1 hypothetical protein ACZ91_34640 [Streptomyces regensis]TWH20711.1 Golgi phosphoprotein 3 GPP34 [Prauserella rugosa]
MPSDNHTVTLADEFVLLLHKGDGTHYDTAATTATAVARIAELTCRDRARLDDGKVYITDSSTTGIGWMDELLTELETRPGQKLSSWLTLQLSTFSDHRAHLLETGLLRKETEKKLGFLSFDYHYPDEAQRERSMSRIRDTADGTAAPDDRTALLIAITHASGLAKKLDLTDAQRRRLAEIADDNALGGAVSAQTAETMAVLVGAMAIMVMPGFDQ